jgi:hypothetical protein
MEVIEAKGRMFVRRLGFQRRFRREEEGDGSVETGPLRSVAAMTATV